LAYYTAALLMMMMMMMMSHLIKVYVVTLCYMLI